MYNKRTGLEDLFIIEGPGRRERVVFNYFYYYSPNNNDMKLRFLFLIVLLIVSTKITLAQHEMSSVKFTGKGIATSVANDYEAIGINPANLGWPGDNKKFHLTFLETGASIWSDALQKSELVNDFWTGNVSFSQADKRIAADKFADHGMAINFDMTWFGISFQSQHLGLAFSVRDRLSGRFMQSKEFAEVMFLGYNAPYFNGPKTIENGKTIGNRLIPKKYSEFLDGTRWQMSWYREYNLALGLTAIQTDLISLALGAGVKYITGFGTFDFRTKDKELIAYSALSPVFQINYGDARERQNPSNVTKGGLVPVGHGFGADLGVSAKFLKRITAAVSITDLGSINWDGNVYEVPDGVFNKYESDGFKSYNIFLEPQKINQISGQSDMVGIASKIVPLPAKLRMGASADLGSFFGAGIDFIAPLNDAASNFDKSIVGLGTWVRPINIIEFSLGLVSGGNYSTMMPAGITLKLGNFWELGAATRDIFTFVSQKTPVVSGSVFFLRFSSGTFDQKK